MSAADEAARAEAAEFIRREMLDGFLHSGIVAPGSRAHKALITLVTVALEQRSQPVEVTNATDAGMKDGYGGLLQSKPGQYLGARGSRWELDSDGQWWFRGYSDRPHPTPDQQDRTENDVRMYGMPLIALNTTEEDNQ